MQSSAFVCICCGMCVFVVAFVCISCGICLHLLWHLFRFSLHICLQNFANVLTQTVNAGAIVSIYISRCANECNNKCIRSYFVKIRTYFV